ncbi:hypothetical protein WI91_05480 [Burkholderia vietnamiensis]|nr:hypothetical protein WI91_05480 [Burkholderia vietnamiensis]
MHEGVVVDGKPRHVAGHVRCHRDRVAVGISVVGALLIARREPPHEPGDQQHQQHRAEDDQRLFSRALAFAVMAVAVAIAAGAAAAIVVRMAVTAAAARRVGVALIAVVAAVAAGIAVVAAGRVAVSGARNGDARCETDRTTGVGRYRDAWRRERAPRAHGRASCRRKRKSTQEGGKDLLRIGQREQGRI